MNLKLELLGEDEFVIYLKKNTIFDINYANENELKKMLKKLFIKLNDVYNIKVNGYYIIHVYIDRNYGTVLQIKREEIEYYDFFDNQVDMKIVLKRNPFLYKVEDFFNINLRKYKVYRYLNDLYLLPKKQLVYSELINLLEKSIIIYDSDKIIKNGIKIKLT